MKTKMISRIFRSCWRGALNVLFVILCFRFIGAAWASMQPERFSTQVLLFCSFALGFWSPLPALFALTVSIPILNGLGHIELADNAPPLGLVFSGIYLGALLHQVATRLYAQRRTLVNEHNRTYSPYQTLGTPFIGYATDIFITAILLSLGVQIYQHSNQPTFWVAWRDRPTFGYSDPFYFLTSAFVWLQGLFFFRMLSSIHQSDGAEHDYRNLRSKSSFAISQWIPSVFTIFSIATCVFYLTQRVYNVPNREATGMPCAPFEDVHSFGSVTVALLVYWVASLHRSSWWNLASNVILITISLTLVIASWSRSAWLAGAVILFLVVSIRLPMKWTLGFVAGAILVVAIVNINAENSSWSQNLYLRRLISLVRLEAPSNKSPERMNLYYKAVGMIRGRPLVGYGIGASYLISVTFARASDPEASTPNFIHNFLLQLAAELGVPMTLLFSTLIIYAFWSALCCSRGDWLVGQMPIALALGAYLLTQMTANALNIYLSNQFFFWLLIVALVSKKHVADHTGPIRSHALRR